MQYVLITGVSSGIGYSLTEHLLKHDFFVFGSVRNEKDSQRLQGFFGPNFKALHFDIRDTEAVQRSRLAVEESLKGNPLKAIVNNAGISVHGPLQYLPIEEIQHQFDVNVMGTLRVIQTYLDLLETSPLKNYSGSQIINISSISGLHTTPFLTPYCASKFALESITEGLRRELLPLGIKVVSVKPGPVETEIWSKALRDKRAYEGTVYESYFSDREGFIQKFKSRTLSKEKVSRLLHRILKSKNPRPSYVITPFPLLFWLQRMVPDSWIDAYYERMFRN